MKDYKNILLVGESGVGKTTYLRRVSSGEYQEKYLKHNELYYVEVLLDNNNIVNVYEQQTSDTFMCYDFLKQFDGIIVMFDVSNMETLFKAHNYWFEKIYPYVRSNIPIILVGNKIDLRCDVTVEEITVIKNDGFTDFYGISCKTGFRIYEPLEKIYYF